METTTQTQTANVYQFPVSRIRRVVAGEGTTEHPAQRVYDTSFAGAWYHQDAIEKSAS